VPREIAIAVPLVLAAILFGVYPRVVLNYTTPTIELTVVAPLVHWNERHDQWMQPIDQDVKEVVK